MLLHRLDSNRHSQSPSRYNKVGTRRFDRVLGHRTANLRKWLTACHTKECRRRRRAINTTYPKNSLKRIPRITPTTTGMMPRTTVFRNSNNSTTNTHTTNLRTPHLPLIPIPPTSSNLVISQNTRRHQGLHSCLHFRQAWLDSRHRAACIVLSWQAPSQSGEPATLRPHHRSTINLNTPLRSSSSLLIHIRNSQALS